MYLHITPRSERRISFTPSDPIGEPPISSACRATAQPLEANARLGNGKSRLLLRIGEKLKFALHPRVCQTIWYTHTVNWPFNRKNMINH